MPSRESDRPRPVDAKQEFFSRVASCFMSDLDIETLRKQAKDLKLCMEKNLNDVESISMLPSFIHSTPTGKEEGQALTIDIGGSTMRVALVNLEPQASNSNERIGVKRQRRWAIGPDIKLLHESEFFGWVAQNVSSFLVDAKPAIYTKERELPTGLVWSFPLDQTQLNDGVLQSMGKGFKFGDQLKGRSLKSCLDEAFEGHGLHLRLDAIMNDCISVILALAYLDPSVEIGVVVGTGFNGALRLPTSALAPEKYGRRSPKWATSHPNVLVDAELCVTGREIFPKTEWDQRISAMLPRPDALGLELLVGGFFMGEIIRQIIVDGVREVGLFAGKLPKKIEAPFSWTIESAALFDSWKPGVSEHVRRNIIDSFGSSIDCTDEDLEYIRDACKAVITRAAAYVAVATSTMRDLQASTNALSVDFRGQVVDGSNPQSTKLVSCVGSVIEKYPGFMDTTQAYLDGLHMRTFGPCEASQQTIHSNVQLRVLSNASLTGVAVAVLQAHRSHSALAESVSSIAKVATSNGYRVSKPGKDVSIEIHQTSRPLGGVSIRKAKKSHAESCTGLLSELLRGLNRRSK